MSKKELTDLIFKKSNAAIDHVYSEFEKYPWDNREAYALWLAQSYFYVSYTTRMLALAASRTKLDENKFHLKFIGHAAEEKGHEKLCINDLKALGHSASDFPELPQTSAIYHSLHYLIENADPCAILGYALVLEGISANRAEVVLEKLTKTYGKAATSFLRVHVEVDKGHNQETKQALEACSEKQLEAILQGVNMVTALYESMLNGARAHVKAQVKVLPFRKAA
jgi:pyrroloquinoline quinone (PQQ) biosynthesis protein C